MRIALALTVAGIIALAFAGAAPVAKLALAAGLPQLAAPLMRADPAVQGVALYQARDYKGADDAFRRAGRGSTYNRGLSLAATGDYLCSLYPSASHTDRTIARMLSAA